MIDNKKPIIEIIELSQTDVITTSDELPFKPF